MSGLTGFQVPRFVEELAPHERTPPRTESPSGRRCRLVALASAAADAVGILSCCPDAAPDWSDSPEGMINSDPRTRESIWIAVGQALAPSRRAGPPPQASIGVTSPDCSKRIARHIHGEQAATPVAATVCRLSRGAPTTSGPQSMMDPPVDHDEERISRHHP